MAENLTARIKRLKNDAGARDTRMSQVTMVRKGEVHLMAPGLFSEDWPKAIISNEIDTIARDFAGVLAPLPSLNCASRAMRTDRDKRKAEKKNKIGAHYWRESDLASQMFVGADRYGTYGFLVGIIEPDFECNMPKIRLMDSIGCYYEKDRHGRVHFFVRVWKEKASDIAEKFPELADKIIPRDPLGRPQPSKEREVGYFIDRGVIGLVLTDTGTILMQYGHGMSRAPVEIAERPGLIDEPLGQFDQVIWTWLARARLALLQLDAAHKAVNAPIIAPDDMVELSIGPDAIIQTANPSGVRKLSLELPQTAFAVSEQLADDVRQGARYPEARNGGINASVVTGRGVQALMGGFDTQIAEAQVVLGAFLSRLTSLCFEMDVTLWPEARKRIMGNSAGEPFDFTYVPRIDISDNWSCDVSYGYAAGLTPNQAVVMLLQLRGDKLISRDTFRRQLPFDVDVDDEQRRIDVNETEDAAMQGLFALLQSVGPMASQGIDPMPVLKAATIFIRERRNGTSVEEAMEKAFTPPEPTPEELAAQQAQEAQAAAPEGAPAPGGDLEGVGPNGLPTGVAPGQAGLPPGGMPDINTLVAGMRSGRPVMDGTVTRRMPI